MVYQDLPNAVWAVDEAADEVLKTAFGDRAVFDGTSYVL